METFVMVAGILTAVTTVTTVTMEESWETLYLETTYAAKLGGYNKYRRLDRLAALNFLIRAVSKVARDLCDVGVDTSLSASWSER
ncbi:hypothetical protein E2C01_060239 [Portunus trituberculatus]|uniref:Uncharacterized protein n=1 Tax=Portunus trituberculatus TaxID=210409 RepID=A0A5B7H864_PORTR|nr:hypothetical protein [Portunus trituberculatus]